MDREIELADVSHADIALKRLVAVHDGAGESATWLLCLEDSEGDDFVMIKWPRDWPGWVDCEFLEKLGFTCKTA